MTYFKKTIIFAVLVLGFASSSFAVDEKKGNTGVGQSVNCPAINTNQDSNKPATDTSSAPAPATNGSTEGR